MKKIIFTLFLSFSICNTGFAESYYFKECKLSEKAYGNYFIDFDKNVINVVLKTTEGDEQIFADKIKLVTDDKIISEIKKKKNTKFSTQYYLDANLKAVIRQLYKSASGIDLILPEGPEKHSYCSNVKADWSKSPDIENKEKIKEKEEEAKKEREKIIEKKKKEELEAKKEKERNKNRHKISIIAKRWIVLSKHNSNSEKKLNIDFDKKANEICSSFGKFKIIEKKIEIVEMDSTPAFGTETMIKLRINGIIDCKEF